MAATALYTSLPDKEGPEKEDAEGDSSEAPLLDGESLVLGKARGGLRGYGYWIIYLGSILVTAGLLSGVQQSLRNDRCDCWDKFNYFCKRDSRQFIKLDELQGLKSPLQLRSTTLSLLTPIFIDSSTARYGIKALSRDHQRRKWKRPGTIS